MVCYRCLWRYQVREMVLIYFESLACCLLYAQEIVGIGICALQLARVLVAVASHQLLKIPSGLWGPGQRKGRDCQEPEDRCKLGSSPGQQWLYEAWVCIFGQMSKLGVLLESTPGHLGLLIYATSPLCFRDFCSLRFLKPKNNANYKNLFGVVSCSLGNTANL